MPEIDVLKAIEYNLRNLVDNYPKKNDGLMLTGHWRFFFRCHAVGTKTKKYETLSWTSFGYDSRLEDTLDVQNWRSSPFDQERIKLAAWKRFSPLLRPLMDGPVSVAARGKELILAAGLHAVRIHLGLEASVFVVSLDHYHALTERCRPGPNKNKAKARRLRSFVLPPAFTVPGSPAFANADDRYINIFAAVVCQECAIIITDFSRLVRLHVMSRSRFWMQEDLRVGAELWSQIWDDDHGPDWVTETDAAIEGVHMWRSEVLSDPQAPAAQTPIIVSLYALQTVFNGIGKHTANDFLHLLGVWPGMPTVELCADDALFSRFVDLLIRYMALWSSREFLQLVAPPANHPNPFAFNYRSHRNYISRYVHVYRKQFVYVSPDFYNHLVTSGLMDPSHIIGTDYDNLSMVPTQSSYKILPVFFYQLGSVKFYSVLRARRPMAWRFGLNDQLTLAPDMRRLANNTTVGLASFREMVSNVQDVTVKWKAGRKKTHYTGKPGRPYKDPRKKDLQKALQVVSGYRYRIRAQVRGLADGADMRAVEDDSDVIPDEDEAEDDEEESDDDIPLSMVRGKRKRSASPEVVVPSPEGPGVQGRVTRSRSRALALPMGG